MNYYVTIEENANQTFEIMTTSIEDGMKFAEKKYNNGDFLLELGNLVSKQMCVDNENYTETTE